MNGITFFGPDIDVVDEVEYIDVPEVQDHVLDDHHDKFELPGDTSNLYAGRAECKQFLTQGTVTTGTDLLNVGGVRVTKGQGADYSFFSPWPLDAPNITQLQTELDAATHQQNDQTIVKRDYASGTHIKNLVCEDSSPFNNPDGYRPGFNCQTGTVFGNFDGLVNSRFRFFPYEDVNGTLQQVPLCEYRFGRSEDVSNAVGDGIFMRRDVDSNTHQRCEIQLDSSLPTIRITAEKDADVPFLEFRTGDGTVVAAVDTLGQYDNKWHNSGTLSDLQDSVAHSLFGGVRSLYIGSMRLSWDVTNKIPIFERLTKIPSALEVSPYNVTTSDLGGVSPDEVTAQKYLQLAHQKSGNSVTAKDVFPVANDSDWVHIGVDYTSDLTDLAQGQLNTIDTSISDVETDITNLQTSVGTNATAITALQNAGSSSPVVVKVFQTMTGSFQDLPDALDVLIWGRHHNATTGGGNGKFNLSNNPANGMHFIIKSHQPINGTGEIQFRLQNSAHSFDLSSQNEDNVYYTTSGNVQLNLQQSGRNTYMAMYLEHDSAKEWYIRKLNDHQITDYGSGQVITAAERAALAPSFFHKYFAPDFGSHTTDATAYVVPGAYQRASIVKGDGTEWHNDSSITPAILKVSLPTNPIDGAIVELQSNLHRNSTIPGETITIVWPGPDSANIATGRYFVSDGTRYETNNSVNVVCNASNLHSRRHYYRFNDDGSAGFWGKFIDTN